MNMKKSHPYLIAEIGVNFYDTARVMNISPMEAAKMYIDSVADAFDIGAYCIRNSDSSLYRREPFDDCILCGSFRNYSFDY